MLLGHIAMLLGIFYNFIGDLFTFNYGGLGMAMGRVFSGTLPTLPYVMVSILTKWVWEFL